MSDPLTLEAMRRKAVDDLYAVFASDVVLEAEVEAILARLATLDAERARPAPPLDVEVPDGWNLLLGREPGGWWATASGNAGGDAPYLNIVSTSKGGTLYATPAEAADALRAALERNRP